MLVKQFPVKGDSMVSLFGVDTWFDDDFIEEERGRLEQDNAVEIGGVGNRLAGAAFKGRFFHLLSDEGMGIDSVLQDEMKGHCDILGAFAVQEHNDYGIDDYPERWLVVLQCGHGYTFEGQGPEGPFKLPLKAGQIIAFNEWKNHRVDIDEEGEAKDRKANYFFTIPNPDFVEGDRSLFD